VGQLWPKVEDDTLQTEKISVLFKICVAMKLVDDDDDDDDRWVYLQPL